MNIITLSDKIKRDYKLLQVVIMPDKGWSKGGGVEIHNPFAISMK